MRIIVIIASCLFSILNSNAQVPSHQLRHSSGNGPYPIYIGLGYIWEVGTNDFGNYINQLDDAYVTTKAQDLHGAESYIGLPFRNNPKKVNPFATTGIELSHTYIQRKYEGDSYNGKWWENKLSARVTFRKNVFYPLTMQLHAGIIFFSRRDAFSQLKSNKQRRSTFKEKNFLENPEIDLRLRIALFDPAGTTGGIGIHLDWRCIGVLNPMKLENAYRIVDKSSPMTENQLNHYLAFGVVIPLAVKF